MHNIYKNVYVIYSALWNVIFSRFMLQPYVKLLFPTSIYTPYTIMQKQIKGF